jgi:hypothetical protein
MNAPRARDLLIVARSDAALHAYLSRYFAGRPDVGVISDRHYGERRRWYEPTVTDRRQAERRQRSVAAELVEFGVATIVAVLL